MRELTVGEEGPSFMHQDLWPLVYARVARAHPALGGAMEEDALPSKLRGTVHLCDVEMLVLHIVVRCPAGPDEVVRAIIL